MTVVCCVELLLKLVDCLFVGVDCNRRWFFGPDRVDQAVASVLLSCKCLCWPVGCCLFGNDCLVLVGVMMLLLLMLMLLMILVMIVNVAVMMLLLLLLMMVHILCDGAPLKTTKINHNQRAN